MASITRDGIRTWYEVRGNGEPLVLLHGFTLDSRMWSMPVVSAGLVEQLAKQYRVILIDTRGHGRSDAPPSGYARGERVNDIIAVLDALAINAAHLVGFSMGGGHSLALTYDYPERVKSLTLVASGAAGWPLGKKLDVLFEKAQTDSVAATRQLWTDWSVSYYREKGRTDIVDAITTIIRDHSFAMFTDTGRGSYPKIHPDIDRAHTITVPTLIQIGSDDRIFVPLAEALHEKISGSVLSVFDNCGHLLTMEAPERWRTEVETFLASINLKNPTATVPR